MTWSQKKRLSSIASNVFLMLFAVVMIFPFLWMISTSFKSSAEVFVYPPNLIPSQIELRGYIRIFTNTRLPFLRFFQNSVFITVIVVLTQVFTSACAGFVFARLRFPGREKLFFLYVATMMIPTHATLIPTFLLMRQYGLVDTHASLILPNLVSAFGTFLMRQFFLTIPDALEDAAKIDGCTPFGTYVRIFLPLSKPSLATLAVFVMLGSWNDYIRPLVFINNINKMTLPLGLSNMKGSFSTDWPVLMAGTVLAILPVLVAFLLAQDFFVKGVTLSGVKG